MEVTQSFWGDPKTNNLQVAQRKNTHKKKGSKQRTAKGKKQRKGDETASLAIKKPRRVQTSPSGYLGFPPATLR